mgnify:CR=1 FL=1
MQPEGFRHCLSGRVSDDTGEPVDRCHISHIDALPFPVRETISVLPKFRGNKIDDSV